MCCSTAGHGGGGKNRTPRERMDVVATKRGKWVASLTPQKDENSSRWEPACSKKISEAEAQNGSWAWYTICLSLFPPPHSLSDDQHQNIRNSCLVPSSNQPRWEHFIYIQKFSSGHGHCFRKGPSWESHGIILKTPYPLSVPCSIYQGQQSKFNKVLICEQTCHILTPIDCVQGGKRQNV